MRHLLVSLSLTVWCTGSSAATWTSLVESLELTELKVVVADLVSDELDRSDETFGEASARMLLEELDLLSPEDFGKPSDYVEAIAEAWSHHPIALTLAGLRKPDWLEDRAEVVADFEQRLNKPLEAKITTGYNVLPEDLWPDFDPELTIVYGHNDLRHARQVLALLYLHGIWPEVTPVVKQSAFLYREAWGGAAGGRGLRQLANGERVIDATEYDLVLEFKDRAEIGVFIGMMNRFAKKDYAEEPSLVYRAWWIPFYRAPKPFPGSKRVEVLLMKLNGFRANLMCLPADADYKAAALLEMDSDWEIERYPVWVNPAFYRGQHGGHR